MTHIINVQNLTVAYREVPALWDVSFSIQKGSMTAIVGTNGAGKSTLMKTMLNLIQPVRGEITIMGESYDRIKEKYKKIAYVPQREAVDWNFPINCLDVVLMGRYGHIGLLKRPGKKDRDLAMEALKRFGMEYYHDRQIDELSGGQKQRVFLARAYVQDADLLFLDEPFGGVDAKTEQMTLELLQEEKKRGRTILVVTHDLHSLKKYFDMVLLLKTKLIASGQPDEVMTPENLTEAYGGMMHMDLRG